MNFRNLTEVRDYKITQYLEKQVRGLDTYQKLDIYHAIEDSPFYFYEKKKYTSNIWLRLSIVFLPFVWLLLFIFLPFTYIISGTWGYGNKMNWLMDWFDKVK